MIRIIITILVYCFVGWLLCDINPYKYYTWYSGIWHGLFSFLTYCAVGSVMLYIKQMITAVHTMCGGGLPPSGVVLGSSLVAVIDEIIDNIYAFQEER